MNPLRRVLGLVDVDLLRDLAALGGVVALVYGVAQLSIAAAWITGGGLACLPFTLAAVRRSRP